MQIPSFLPEILIIVNISLCSILLSVFGDIFGQMSIVQLQSLIKSNIFHDIYMSNIGEEIVSIITFSPKGPPAMVNRVRSGLIIDTLLL